MINTMGQPAPIDWSLRKHFPRAKGRRWQVQCIQGCGGSDHESMRHQSIVERFYQRVAEDDWYRPRTHQEPARFLDLRPAPDAPLIRVVPLLPEPARIIPSDVVEVIEGSGEVFDCITPICRVRYKITVHSGQRPWKVELTVLEGLLVNNYGTLLTLHLEDGRKLPFNNFHVSPVDSQAFMRQGPQSA